MLIALFRLLSKIPLPLLHALGVVLGWLVYCLSPTYRRNLRDHIKRAGFDSHWRMAVSEAGKYIAELPFIWYASPSCVQKKVVMNNWGVAQHALDAQHGVIFLTPHLGCFEVIAQAIASKTPLVALYRPPRKEGLKLLVEEARARDNLQLVPANLSGVRTLLATLKNRGSIGLLPDQVPQQGEGAWANFFGRPAYTMTLPAKLQHKAGATLVLTYAERLPKGRGYRIHFEHFTQALEGTAEQQALIINAAMERLIAKCPAQYFWSYDRYKIPSGITPPGSAG